jgi:hypothetical protein
MESCRPAEKSLLQPKCAQTPIFVERAFKACHIGIQADVFHPENWL